MLYIVSPPLYYRVRNVEVSIVSQDIVVQKISQRVSLLVRFALLYDYFYELCRGNGPPSQVGCIIVILSSLPAFVQADSKHSPTLT